jgi:hypothetical protein
MTDKVAVGPVLGDLCGDLGLYGADLLCHLYARAATEQRHSCESGASSNAGVSWSDSVRRAAGNCRSQELSARQRVNKKRLTKRSGTRSKN